MAIVKNINKGVLAKEICKSKSLIEHWDKVSCADRPSFCIVEDCFETEIEGVLVLKHQNSDPVRYIAPMCKKHASQYEHLLDVISYSWLESSGLEDTCDRKDKIIKHNFKENTNVPILEHLNNSHK